MTDQLMDEQKRKELLKHMILQLHSGEAPETVRNQLIQLLRKIPYDEVVEVEQELINEGLPAEEVMEFCDIHTAVLDGHIDTSEAKEIPAGHPVDTFKKENEELLKVVDKLNTLYSGIHEIPDDQVTDYVFELKACFNNLMDVDKHYKRKEYLLFPFLEKYEISGPPKVMWGKHDEERDMLKNAQMVLNAPGNISKDELITSIEFVLKPASNGIADMTMKEEQIMFPMSMDKLNDSDWYEIATQSIEYGFCLYDPKIEWKPDGVVFKDSSFADSGRVQLPTGSFNIPELMAIMNTLPVEVTFVDKDDVVKYFSAPEHQIFNRGRAALGRNVRLCHPPKSVHVVEQILADFKSGKEDKATFWIQMQDKFIHIEYFALRDDARNYLGTMEIVQDLTDLRKLDGEQRLVTYGKK
jgi:DUF438 domain-containing protein